MFLVTTAVWELGAAGALGAILTEAAEVALFIKRYAHVPWITMAGWRGRKVDGIPQPSLQTYFLGVFLKTGVAFALVTVLASADQISGAYGALVTGAGALVTVSRLTAQGTFPEITPGAEQATTTDQHLATSKRRSPKTASTKLEPPDVARPAPEGGNLE
ncbi:hypothetical protein ACFVWG_20725 [Kribbella sp. NPDC058245]|uniref:hypothetical protein n=1 Tax=Kribbella sp. NPDC058245 TaxID=3346399 RepID=UPI0036E9C665